MTPLLPVVPNAEGQTSLHKDAALKDAAVALEASFLAEMLKSAGFGEARSTLGGGAGEDQFSSFLVQEHAMQIAKAGGLGLAESIFHALKARGDV